MRYLSKILLFGLFVNHINSQAIQIYFGTSNSSEKINNKISTIDMNENETDILMNQDISRLIIGYDKRKNLFDLDDQDILVHEGLQYDPNHAISLTSLSEWKELAKKYNNAFEQIIFYHSGMLLESFVESETDLTSFVLLLNKMLKKHGKIVFKSVKINAHCSDLYGYDINFSKSQLVNYAYIDLQRVYNLKNTSNISKKYLCIINQYIKLCKKFNFKLNYIAIEKEDDDINDNVSYLGLELEKM